MTTRKTHGAPPTFHCDSCGWRMAANKRNPHIKGKYHQKMAQRPALVLARGAADVMRKDSYTTVMVGSLVVELADGRTINVTLFAVDDLGNFNVVVDGSPRMLQFVGGEVKRVFRHLGLSYSPNPVWEAK